MLAEHDQVGVLLLLVIEDQPARVALDDDRVVLAGPEADAVGQLANAGFSGGAGLLPTCRRRPPTVGAR